MGEQRFNTIKVKSRKAIAMIELIFAIVVIGIALLSVPNLIYTATESGYTSMQQEAIAAASSDISLILTKRWDEKNTDPRLPAIILQTDSTTAGLTQATRTNLHSRSFFSATGGTMTASASSTFQSTTNVDGDLVDDDIDDVLANTGGHVEDGTQDLIDTIAVSTSVDYLSDSPTGSWTSATTGYDDPFATTSTPSTNVKGIVMTLTSGGTTPELQKTIKLQAFSCNIGSYQLERKEF